MPAALPAAPRFDRRVVLSQLGPGGEGGDLPPTPDYLWLRQFLEEHPLRNGNEWLAEMMAQDHRGQMLGALCYAMRVSSRDRGS